MTWKELLVEKRVETHTTSKQELDDLRSASNVTFVTRPFPNSPPITDSPWLTKRPSYLERWPWLPGYRVKGQGANQTTFTAVKLALGAGINNMATYLDRCRRKRNELSYDVAGVVTDTEAAEILRSS